MRSVKLRCTRRAFTYADAMVALLMVAILAAAAWPSLRDFTMRQKLSQAAQRLAYDLRWCRLRAVRAYQPVTVQFLAQDGAYTVEGHPDPLTKRSPYTVRLATFASGVVLHQVTFANGQLIWSAGGLPSEAGSVTLGYGPWRTTVSVNAAGMISIGEVWFANPSSGAQPNAQPKMLMGP